VVLIKLCQSMLVVSLSFRLIVVQPESSRIVDQPSLLNRSQSIPLVNTSSTKPEPFPSSSYRMQAAALMSQIKNDMKGSKRIFSGDSEVSRITHVDDRSLSILPSPDSLCSPASSDDKENNHNHSQQSFSNASDHSFKFRPRLKASPRKLLRRLSAADEVDRELAEVVSNITVEDNLNSHVPIIQINSEPTLFLAPPSNLQPTYPSSSAQTATGEDFNRFVSTSTASGTTLTAGSVPSFAKHPGAVQIHRILPNDVPILPERVGRMIYDKVMMKWVKSTAMVSAGIIEDDSRERGTEETSNDPFRDIHSLNGDRSHGRVVASEEGIANSDEQPLNTGMEDVVDEEEAELNSFSFDAAFPVVENGPTNMQMDGPDGDITTDSEDDIGVNELSLAMPGPDQCDNFDSEDESEPEPGPSTLRLFPSIIPQHAVDIGTPSHAQRDRKAATPVIRSVLKSTSATPASVLKDASRSRHKTPPNKTDRRRHRSVSFSDGKRDGPIRGLGRNARKHDDYARSESDRFVPSVRSKRIAHMMNDLEDSSE
jgi:protein NUD1